MTNSPPFSPAVLLLTEVTEVHDISFSPWQFSADVAAFGPERAIERFVAKFPGYLQAQMRVFLEERSILTLLQEEAREDEPIVTKTGKVLTDADIEALADEAERGYCVTRWGPGNSLVCGLPMPCPIHVEEARNDEHR